MLRPVGRRLALGAFECQSYRARGYSRSLPGPVASGSRGWYRMSAHARDRAAAALVRGAEGKCGGLIVVHGAKPVAPRRQDLAVRKRRIRACARDIRDGSPFSQPGAVIGEIDGVRRADAFGNGGAAVPRRANETRELEQQILAVEPD